MENLITKKSFYSIKRTNRKKEKKEKDKNISLENLQIIK